jgi:hypothetical protein
MKAIDTYSFFAYVDPGTGSYLLQLAMAGVLGAGYALKHYWARLKRLFTSSGDDAGS